MSTNESSSRQQAPMVVVVLFGQDVLQLLAVVLRRARHAALRPEGERVKVRKLLMLVAQLFSLQPAMHTQLSVIMHRSHAPFRAIQCSSAVRASMPTWSAGLARDRPSAPGSVLQHWPRTATKQQ